MRVFVSTVSEIKVYIYGTRSKILDERNTGRPCTRRWSRKKVKSPKNAISVSHVANVVTIVIHSTPSGVSKAGYTSKLNRGNWKTQAHTGRLFVDYIALSNNRCIF